MIELNLTYEESKKILELGYDFSPVCPFYRVVKANSISLYNGIEFIFNLGLIDRLESEVLAELEREQIHPNLGKNYRKSLLEKNIFTEIIPIVPKAALEACLPDINPSNDERLPDLDICRLRVSKYHTDMCDREHEEIIREFSSVFEAFTWCHENYPKELKKKFNEVMK